MFKILKYKLFLPIFLLSLLRAAPASAGLLENLDIRSNANRPEIWEDQLGGFATGGSLHMRAPSSNIQLLHIDLPSFSAGCSGIDLFGGGFGYINSAELEKLLKNIGTSALSYSVMLTIKTLSPAISDLLGDLESMARSVNSQNINSCQIGASIASGMFQKTESAQQLACQSRKMGDGVSGAAADFFTARHKCQDSSEMITTNAKSNDSKLPAEYNLVWEALKKGGLARNDKEFLMSLSGTLIARKGSKGNRIFENKSSLIRDDGKLFETLIFGENGQINLYVCDEEDKCLNPKKNSTSFARSNSMLSKVENLISEISIKVLKEQSGGAASLTAQEKELVTRTSIPIIKLLLLWASNKGHGLSVAVEDYAESIAFDYVINYLDALLDDTYRMIVTLEYSQIEGETIKNFKEELRMVRKLLLGERTKAFARLQTILSVKEKTRQLERIAKLNFTSFREGREK